MVELVVLALPLVVTLLALMIQLAVVLIDWMHVTDSASRAARAGAVARFAPPPNNTPCLGAQQAIDSSSGMVLDGCTVSTVPQCPSNSSVKVIVKDTKTVSLPLIPVSKQFDLTSDATECLQ
jgi:hypothetical protein